jgi:uncharacterized protein YdhG (YjbR/CyaY superfamily)
MKSEALQEKQEVDAYLESVPVEARKALVKLRKQIKAASPKAEEGFSYGVPAFKIDGRPLVCYAAFKHHCGFYPMSRAVIQTHKADLSQYETAKGTVKFTTDKPLPAALVKKIVKARMAELRSKAK